MFSRQLTFWFLATAALPCVHVIAEESLPDFMEPIRDLAAIEVVDGRLRLNPAHWQQTAYPDTKGDPLEQLLADKDHEHDPSFISDRSPELRQKLLYVYSGAKLLNDIRRESRSRSYGIGQGGASSNLQFSSAKVVATMRVELEPSAHFSYHQHGREPGLVAVSAGR